MFHIEYNHYYCTCRYSQMASLTSAPSLIYYYFKADKV